MENHSRGYEKNEKNKNSAIIKCSFVIELCWRSSFSIEKKGSEWIVGGLWSFVLFFPSSRTLVLSQSGTPACRKSTSARRMVLNWQNGALRRPSETGRRRPGQGDGSQLSWNPSTLRSVFGSHFHFISPELLALLHFYSLQFNLLDSNTVKPSQSRKADTLLTVSTLNKLHILCHRFIPWDHATPQKNCPAFILLTFVTSVFLLVSVTNDLSECLTHLTCNCWTVLNMVKHKRELWGGKNLMISNRLASLAQLISKSLTGESESESVKVCECFGLVS